MFNFQLIGYESQFSFGFALPLYGLPEQTNTLYASKVDHQQNVVDFVPFQPQEFSEVTIDQRYRMDVGSKQKYVFLTKSRTLIGNASEIWNEIVTDVNEVLDYAPLSFIDAALNANIRLSEGTAYKVKSTIIKRLGERGSNAWVRVLVDQIYRKMCRVISEPHRKLALMNYSVGTSTRAGRMQAKVVIHDPLGKLPAVMFVGISSEIKLYLSTFGITFDGVFFSDNLNLEAIRRLNLTEQHTPRSLEQIARAREPFDSSIYDAAILFVCDDNTALSVIAEGLATEVLDEKIYSTSCGVSVGPEIDESAIAVCKEFEIDVSHIRPKTMDDMQLWGDDLQSFTLIVALSPSAQRLALDLTRFYHVDVEYWPVINPVGLGQNESEKMEAYGQAYKRIREYIDQLKRRGLHPRYNQN